MNSNVLYIRNIDDQLKREFKALCALRGKTLTDEMQRLMREELERRKKGIEKDVK